MDKSLAVEIGLALPQYDYSVPGEHPLRWSTTVEWATRADDLGFGSVWLSDHLFLSIEKYGGDPGEHFGFDPIVGLGALAEVTHKVRLGTLVLCVHLRPPRLLAKQLSTLESLAPGRLIAGVGAGWFEPEYEAAGLDFPPPAQRLRDLGKTLDILGDVLGDRVPRWVGGRGDRLLERAVEHADGWNTAWAVAPADYRRRLAQVERACERIGRDPSTFELSLALTTLVGEDESDLRRRYERFASSAATRAVPPLDELRKGRLVGTVEDVRSQIDEWESLGVRTIICGLGALPFSVTAADDDLHLVASALLQE